jgi:hypothetical protein
MRPLARHAITGGYFASSNPLAVPPGCIVTGSKNLLFLPGGRPQIPKGPVLQGGVAGGRAMFNLPDGGYGSLGDATTAGIGSIVGLVARAIAYVGAGPLYLNGVSRAVSASTAAQILLYVSGSYTGAGTGPFTMGVQRALAPVIAETPTVDAAMSGTISTVHWFIRSATGGRGRASEASNILVVNGKTVRHTVNALDVAAAAALGYDRLAIASTVFGFGAAGPYYFLKEIALSSLTTVDGVANSTELQYTSNDLSQAELAPVLDFTPPAFVFMAALEDVLSGIGAYGDPVAGVTATEPGTAVVTSLPVYIESWPFDNISYLPEKPTGVLSRASEGFCFIACKNSLHAQLYTGGRNPTTVRTIWAQVGFLSQHNMTLAEGGRLYGYSSGKRGLVRLGEDGEPETAWAAAVAEDTRAWVAQNVVCGWDGDHQVFVAGHGQTLLCFAPALYGQGHTGWSAPYDLTGKVTGNLCACVTVGGALLLATNDGATVRLYSFNAGTGAVCEVYFPVTVVDAESAQIFRLRGGFRADNTANPVQLKLFVNGAAAAAYDSGNIAVSRVGQQPIPVPVRPNQRNAVEFQPYLKMTGTGGDDCGPDYLEALGEVSNVVLSGVSA